MKLLSYREDVGHPSGLPRLQRGLLHPFQIRMWRRKSQERLAWVITWTLLSGIAMLVLGFLAGLVGLGYWWGSQP